MSWPTAGGECEYVSGRVRRRLWSRVASRDLTPLYVKLETLINEREERMKGLAVVDGECRLLIVRYANRLHATSASASAYER